VAEAVVPERSSEPISHIEPREELPVFEKPRAVHGGRFLIGYAVVVLMVGAALGALALMTRSGGSDDDPVAAGTIVRSDGFQRAREIAAQVSRQYRGANGEQLAAVTAQPGEIQGLPLQYIALRHGRNRPLTEGDVQLVSPGETTLFSFCGLGGLQNCALAGEPSAERLTLLRREAVELSLYTFKLLPNIETVVSLLPPVPRGNGQPPQTLAIYFQRAHLADVLSQPMSKLLPERPPYQVGDVAPGEAELVNRLTETRLFSSSFEQLQTQGVLLNLEPPTAQ